MSLVLSPPPPTPIEPVTEVLYDDPVTDPHRWLPEQVEALTHRMAFLYNQLQLSV